MCAQCASERKPFMDAPEVVDVTTCAHCGKLERGGVWTKAAVDAEGAVEDALATDVWVDPELTAPDVQRQFAWEDEKNAMVQVRLAAEFRGHPVARERTIRVRLKTSVCQDCSRQYGGYFEAIVQIRASDEHVFKVLGEEPVRILEDSIESYREQDRAGSWVARADKVRGGFDLYVGSLETARQAAHALKERYGAEYEESGKLVGRRDGRDLYRFTLLVRLPPYLPGDFILMDDHLFRVLRFDGRRLSLWDLRRRDRIHREPKRARSLKVVGRAKDEEEAVVVSFRPGTLQLLDPVTLRTVDLAVEDDYAGKQTVPVFRHDDQLYVLPMPQAKA